MKTLKPRLKPRKRQTAGEFLELQRLMAGAVMNPLTSDGDMQPKWRDGQPMKKVADGFIKPNDRLTSFERLEIYNRQYWYRIKDCFYEDYPGLRAVLGQQKFERLALAYLAQYPSESFTLRNLGRRLIPFLEANPRWIRPRRKPALDMARLEWAHIEAFDNEAKPKLTEDSLRGADPASLRLQLQPHLSLLRLGYELDTFLIKLKQDDGLRSEASNAIEVHRAVKRKKPKLNLQPKPLFLAVHRHENTVYYKRLDAGQFHLLTALQSGATIGEACESLVASGKGDVSLVRKWFESWAALGWFCKIPSSSTR